MENFFDYTEIDPNDRAAISASEIVLSGMMRSDDVRVYRDFGENYFNGFEIDIAFSMLSSSNIGARFICLAVANSIGSQVTFGESDISIQLRSTTNASPLQVVLTRGYEVGVVSTYLNFDDIYYATLFRVAGGSSVTLNIYSAPNRINLISSIVLPGIDGAYRYRYLHAINQRYAASSAAASGFVSELDYARISGGTGRLIGGPGRHPLISGPGNHPLISCGRGGNALIG